MKVVIVRVALMISVLSCLASCETTPPEPVTEPEPGVVSAPYEPVVVEAVTGPTDEVRRAMILADMLYDARLAIEDNRLMTPAGNNAYDMLRTVLDYDPGNEVALQSMQDIVDRYLSLADAAIQLAQFDRASTLLDRAESINSNEKIRQKREVLKQAMSEDAEIHVLDPEMLTRRQQDIVDELGNIGRTILSRDARFLITARTDEEGRWMYRMMREGVGGERLRGDIAVGSRPGIRIILTD